ncbi:uncharacterized protein GGS22DRAFT_171785 [Annulohypoxylon maeteangense]|uniref:uncharacterized protein n=1 Tax=Annulohypoxylon maeteangense TaxID=1927788 RepID=UPI002007FF4A|nr:uncharacterized protein GGS22DRAFT_171785 [Annulohypoxylon maeteangense]KAI0881757.1 hypothetical protein GGS22DRAFT_171785 [Annulohypoxylon maeteangense]
MSIRISLDAPPEFYTNLDIISGRVILVLNRAESIGNVIVKLEGESRTALTVPSPVDRDDYYHARPPGGAMGGDVITENHKILYRVFQVYPDEGGSIPLQPGMHEFKFNFKFPLNNICHDEKAMSALLGLGGIGSSTGFRTMDGTKQLMLQHVKSTLPPSLTGFPQEAEIRYYLKVTIQRPGFFKENWRYQVGFKFLPIEPPRPAKTSQEAFARRPFTFRARAPQHHRKSIFGNRSPSPNAEDPNQMPPNIEMSARLPFPSILTCNKPLPLRIIARKLAPTTTRDQQVYVTALEIALTGYTQVRVQNLENTEVTTFPIFSAPRLSPPIALFSSPSDPVDTEFEIPQSLWADRRLPNTVAPSFRTCNLMRRYDIQMKITLSWGMQPPGSSISLAPGRQPIAQTITLPLKLSNVEVFSGIAPPPELLNSVSHGTNGNIVGGTGVAHNFGVQNPRPPQLPHRHNPPNLLPPQAAQQQGPQQQRPPHDPLYPPQLGTPANAMFDDAPPSYDEAMADQLAGPAARPAYSGVTAENAPSTMPAQKS